MKKEIIKDFSLYLKYDILSITFLTWIDRDINLFSSLGEYKRFLSTHLDKDAGTMDVMKNGYKRFRVRLCGHSYLNSRIIYSLFYGEIPSGLLIDHIDGNPLNNKISNLRAANYTENKTNSKIRSDSKIGIKGITKSGSKWAVTIQSEGIKIYCGTFKTIAEAKIKYDQASKVYHGEFAKS